MAALFVRLLPGVSGDVGLVPNLQILIVGYRCGTPVRMSAKGRHLPVPGGQTNDPFRRYLAVAARSGVGPVTEPTADAQPWRRERVLMPLSRHCAIIPARPGRNSWAGCVRPYCSAARLRARGIKVQQ